MATTSSIYNKLLNQGMDPKVAATKAKKLAALVPDTQATTAKTTTPTVTATPPTASGYQQSAAVEEALANLQSIANSSPAAYKSPYESQIQALLSEISGREPFSYNAENDAAYQIYKDQYTDAAKLAMADTMGEAAALTGGYGSSYASTAGNQAYQSYTSQLTGMIPELYQAAYDRYNAEGDNLLDKLSMYQALDESAYSRHRDDANDVYTKLSAANDIYNTLYNQDYGQYRDSVSDDQWNQSFSYQKEQDALAQSNWQKEYDRSVYENDRNYQRSVYENDRNYQRSVYESDRDYNFNAQKLQSSLAAAQQETTATGVIDSAEATELYRKMYESGEYEKASDIALQLMNTYMNADEESFLNFAYNFRLPDDNGNVVLLIDLLTDTVGEGTIVDSNFPNYNFPNYYYTK